MIIKRILLLAVGIACVPFLVFGADKPFTLFTDPVRCGPCRTLEGLLNNGGVHPLTGQRVPKVENWEFFINIRPWEESPDGGAPYLRDNATGSKVNSYPYAIIQTYVKSYEEAMQKKTEEEAAKALAKKKEIPVPQDVPRDTPAPKLPNTITFSGVQPIDPKDPNKGFFVIKDGKKITFNKPDSEAYKLFLGNYMADPANAGKVTYDMSTVKPYGITPRPLGDPALPPPADGLDVTVMPRLRPTPDTYLNPLITELEEETDADGKTYRVFSIMSEELRFDKDGKPIVDKNGNAIYFPVERRFRVLAGSPMPLARGALQPMPLLTPPKPKNNLDGPPTATTEAAIRDAYEKLIELQKKMTKMGAGKNKGEDEE